MAICICYLVLEMADNKRVMYNGFSKKSGHSTEWVQIVKKFLNKTFADGRRVAKCLPLHNLSEL
jgi:hypothetical protein